MANPRGPRRHGLGAVEVLVIVGLIGFAAILAMMALPRGRESSRLLGCQRNLMQVGVGLQMYHQMTRHYPTTPRLEIPGGTGAIRAMLDALVIPDLLDLRDPTNPPTPTRATPPGLRVPGLACPSDPNAMTGPSRGVTSYRANTGETPTGLGGPFQPGRTWTSAEIEAADGLSYTAAFAERLVGDARPAHPAPCNYSTSDGPVDEGSCPDAPLDRWRGDAGADWAEASWRSTLYQHALEPNADRSCVSIDGRTARMGASSGHPGRINVLLLDGSLRAVTPSIDPKVWRQLGSVGPPSSRPAP